MTDSEIKRKMINSIKKMKLDCCDARLKSVGHIRQFTLGMEYYFYSISFFYSEAAKEIFKHLLVNKKKYNMGQEEINNIIKGYNLYDNYDLKKHFKNDEEYDRYIKKLENITDKIKFEYKGNEYTFKVK